jgi:hypothetical protein
MLTALTWASIRRTSSPWGNRFLAGREFTTADGMPASLAVIVNRQCAETFWHGQDALGKRLRLYKKDVAQPWLTVVGVVPNIVHYGESRVKRKPTIYLPWRQQTPSYAYIAARSTVHPSTLKQTFRREVQAIDNDLPVLGLRTILFTGLRKFRVLRASMRTVVEACWTISGK